MKQLLVALLCAAALAGCSSEYLISTNDGQMITTDSKPKLDPDSGMYIFKDAKGREQAIPATSVKQVIER